MSAACYDCKTPWRLAAVSAIAAALMLSGCGKKNAEQEGAQQTGQVIAHVGNESITIQELENEFRLANVPPDKRSNPVVKRVLSELTARKYLVQQAIAAKLDREPTVHLDVIRAREQVLSGAIVQRNLASKASAIGKAEIDKYIGAHPSQFAKREILTTEQISLPITASSQSVIDATKDFKSLDQVEQKLNEMGVMHTRSTGFLDSGNIPDEFLSAVQAKKADDIFFVRSGTTGTFFKITGEQAKPLTGDEAANRARQLLRIEMLKAEGEQTTQAAETEAKYEGDYARIMANQLPAKDASPGQSPGTETAPAKN